MADSNNTTSHNNILFAFNMNRKDKSSYLFKFIKTILSPFQELFTFLITLLRSPEAIILLDRNNHRNNIYSFISLLISLVIFLISCCLCFFNNKDFILNLINTNKEGTIQNHYNKMNSDEININSFKSNDYINLDYTSSKRVLEDIKIENGGIDSINASYDIKSNNSDNAIISDSMIKKSLFKSIKSYEFYNNITTFNYEGQWERLDKYASSGDNNDFNINDFKHNKGKAYLTFVRNINYSLYSNPEDNIVLVYLQLIDGQYHNIRIDYAFNISLPYVSEASDYETKDLLSGSVNNVLLKQAWSNFLRINENACNNTNFDYVFYHNRQEIERTLQPNRVAEYSKIKFNIRSKNSNQELANSNEISANNNYKELYNNNQNFPFSSEKLCSQSLTIQLSIQKQENLTNRLSNYSAISIFLSILNIYHTIILFNKVLNNNQVGENICLITLSTNIIYNSLVSTIHFFLTVWDDEYAFYYILPCISYFILFSIIEIRLLFFALRSRYIDLQFDDQSAFKKKLCKFYFVFYFCMVMSFVFLKFLYNNVIMFYCCFAFTWFFQIIHSARKGVRPVMNFKYLSVISISKLFYVVSLLSLY